jgi:nucleotide-binding universal stress UspA family protein
MTRISNILVPVDFSEPSKHAMHYATGLARKFGAKLTAAHIIPPLFEFNYYAYPANIQEFEKQAFEQARKLVPQEIPAEFREHFQTQTIVKGGDVREELLGIVADEKVDLVVMGTHGYRAFKRFFLGSTTENMLRRIPVPVLTVSERGERAHAESPFDAPFRRILYATDVVESGTPGLRYCAELARTLGAQLTMLHVNDLRDTVAFDDDTEVRARLMGELHKTIEREHCGDVGIAADVVNGTPHEAILKYADAMKADLIVINLQGKGLLERALLGSTAERVIRSARVPVLSVPAAAAGASAAA